MSTDITALADIDTECNQNKHFRSVVDSKAWEQIVFMCLKPGEFIAREKHETFKQSFRVTAGMCVLVLATIDAPLDEYAYTLNAGDYITVPPNTWHKMVNYGDTRAHMISTYPHIQHKPGTVHRRQADAEAAERG